MKKKVKKKVSKKKKIVKKKPNSVQAVMHSSLTLGQRAADFVTAFLGSWGFIFFFIIFMVIWIFLNVKAYFGQWDPYPFILLNFVLSCLAAMQAPIILMSQNRQTERDRISFKYDYQVNRKAEREIQKVLKELNNIKRFMYKEIKKKK